MGWRWRKSFGRGPFRISMSRRGIGWSLGIPGLRFGRSPDGRTCMSQGIPGTGLYRIKYFPRATTPATQTQPQPPPPPTQAQIPSPYPPARTPTSPPNTNTPVNQTGTISVLLRATRAITRFFDRLF